MKRSIVFLLCICLFAGLLPVSVQAAEIPVQAPSCILLESSTGQVIYEKNADQPMPPASVTKIMTLLLVMEAIEAGELSWQDTVTGSAHAASMGGSQIWLKEGEQFTVEEMVKCIAVASANDCSVAMAEHLAGSEQAFVARMNERAKELGMYNTNFVNCCGLEAEGHQSTARDIAIMSAQLLRHEKITEFTTIWMDTIRNGAFGLTNTNKMIRTYEGMLGLKTGYTSDAGYCLSAAAGREGMTLIVVVLRGETSASRNSDVASLLNYGFAHYVCMELTPDRPLMPVPVVMGKQDAVAIRLEGAQNLLLEKARLKDMRKTLSVADQVEAPVAEGQVLGSFEVRDAGGELLYTTQVIAGETVERLGLGDLWKQILQMAMFRGA